MQAVILAAGRGTRMRELTDDLPKPLIPLAGKPLIDYQFEALPDAVDEVIIVVGYLGSMIHNHLGGEYEGRRVLYVEQDQLNGTADAVWRTKDLIKEKFVVMNSDDIYIKEDLEKCVAEDWAMLVYEMDEMYGADVVISHEGFVTDVIENHQPKEVKRGPGISNAALYVLEPSVFSLPLIPKEANDPEYGLPQTLVEGHVPLKAVFATKWIRISSPEDLKEAEAELAARS